MPLDETDYRVLRALNKKQQARIWSLADREGMTFEHPEYVKARKRFEDSSMLMRQYETENRIVNDEGKLASEPPTRLPPSAEAAAKEPTSGEQLDPPLPPVGSNGEAYFFEPSIPEVQTLLRKDPQAALRAGLDPSWITGIATPEHKQDVLDTASGMKMGENVIPATTHLDELTKDRSAYDTMANYLYAQRLEEARKQGVNLKRYRDIPLKGNVPDFLKGGAIYNIERRLTPGVLGVADAATLGLASPAGDALTKGISNVASSVGIDIGPQPTAEDVRNRSP